MLPYKNLIIIDKKDSLPVYRQISLQLISLIQEGKLPPGAVLPSTRTLAFDLQLHRKTIVAAYETLVSENWIDNLPRKSYTVSPDLPMVRPRSYNSKRVSPFAEAGTFDFDHFELVMPLSRSLNNNRLEINDGFPDISLLPVQAISRQFKKALEVSASSRRSGVNLDGGSSNFKTSLRSFLNQTRGIDMGEENLFTTRGAQMAIYIAASLIIKPGDKVVVSEPTYFIAEALFEKLGAELIRVPMDGDGMCTEKLEDILKKNVIKMLYIIPHHHHPTTVTMSVERRNHLMKLITAYNFAVIEDDYDYDFQFKYDPYLPLASGDHGGRIIYIGSLTKVLGSPFRLGYMIATSDFLQAAARLRTLIDLRGDFIMEETISGMIANGDLARHIQKTNKLYSQRCDFLSDLVSSEMGDMIDFTKPTGGMALWLRVKPQYDLSKIIKKADLKGLTIKGSTYCIGKDAHFNAFRFGFASLNEQELTEAVHIIKTVAQNL
ncbi:GntR family transcriptional regulator/MocR family aminotransferase [Flavobacterium sp. 2755]|uniref:aminotransferase-like domain-containing protein n=1 Tax=Flavobacterium sp. 2755 TaxID=2817765 RepID=UPI002863D9F9|nr:PLP-dependent aminotransferase family protein [Flavobacterium sp. 2755]MDR6762028.1 GntR family transcriptional regulator/MocR family aminotransferase [Flavobacterium sp. 2755]